MLDTAENLSALEVWTVGFIYFCILYHKPVLAARARHALPQQ